MRYTCPAIEIFKFYATYVAACNDCMNFLGLYDFIDTSL
jgi:hypothetical protein